MQQKMQEMTKFNQEVQDQLRKQQTDEAERIKRIEIQKQTEARDHLQTAISVAAIEMALKFSEGIDGIEEEVDGAQSGERKPRKIADPIMP